MTIANAVDNEPIEFNRVYVAPPDRHMMIERGRVRLLFAVQKRTDSGPAIDPLFRSAAYSYGSRVIGVIPLRCA
jgi:two-component system chemotaxis response regulator CheB